MTVADIVSMLDKKYSGEGMVKCPNDGKDFMLPQSKKVVSDHGGMGVHASGSFIICGVCGAKEAVGRPN